jgi:hypothetical protein
LAFRNRVQAVIIFGNFFINKNLYYELKNITNEEYNFIRKNEKFNYKIQYRLDIFKNMIKKYSIKNKSVNLNKIFLAEVNLIQFERIKN